MTTRESERPSILARLLLAIIWCYRTAISPILPPLCRFEPSCSQYTREAIELHGALRGGWIGFLRILQCRPGGGSGYNPVPLLDSEGSPRRDEPLPD